MKDPLVSIIITTKNEADMIARLFNSINNQSYQNIEVIVVDNNSDDYTKEIARMFTKKIYNKGPERSAQRNFGAKKSRGKYLLFLDADMGLNKGVIEECVNKMASNNRIGALVIPEKSVTGNFWEKIKAFERAFYKEDEITNAARFFRKDVFYKIGRYDQLITGGEDWDITDRVKRDYLICRVSACIYHYERIPSLFSLLKKKYYYGSKSHIYFKKHNISLAGPKAVYFLRPVFYKQWQKIIRHPLLSLAMIFMLSLETVAGALGYLKGKYHE